MSSRRSQSRTRSASKVRAPLIFLILFANSPFLSVTNFVIDDLKATIDRASRDYDTLRQSVSAVDRAVCRAIEHARAASEVLGTEGFLAYFEEAKSNEDPDAVDLLNRLAKGYNETMTAPDSIASVSPLFDCFSYSSLTSSPLFRRRLVKPRPPRKANSPQVLPR